MKLTYDHFHIRCQDVEAGEKFYTEVLGGEVEARKQVPGMSITKIRVGGVIISLSPAKQEENVDPLSGNPCWGAYQVAFTVDDIEGACKEIEAKGGTVSSGPKQIRDDLKVAFVPAPDGVEIELMQFV